jgi:hypothetical protein
MVVPTHRSAEVAEQAWDRETHLDLPSYAASDSEFRTLVRAGIASFEAGPTYDLAAVEAELRDIISGEG